ncbi:MAG: SBBP repeat-containing protein [Lewinella sp.]|uniref:SBBP repeat-containing protein n=1 Tax=Lewinella sp. TaxID=2004506 RepID=UPI003D6AA244
MKQSTLFILGIFLFGSNYAQNTVEYHLDFSTFMGGNHFEQARDLAIDAEGNIYITGGTSSDDFPTTPGAYNTTYNNAGSATVGGWGPMMVFVSKFSPEGTLLWSTLLGGPNYDRAYAIEVDDDGYVYVGGRAGDDFPTTTGAFQEEFVQGSSINNLYGHQNGFIAKLSPDGADLVWATYYGGDSFGFFRDIDIDEDGYVYGILNAVRLEPAGISIDAFDTSHNGSYDMVAVKFNQDVSAVEWATFLGGSGEDRGGPAVRIGTDKSVFIGGATKSNNFPTTANAVQTQRNGSSDFFVTRIAPDGTDLIYSTYFGGNSDEFSETHSLHVDHLNQAYVACGTLSTDIPTTLGAIKPTKTDINDVDALFFKLSADGSQLLACTYFGGLNGDSPEGLRVDQDQNLYVGGGSNSDDLPVTADAPQAQLAGGHDGFVVKLNLDFSEALFCSYYGGSDDESVRAFGLSDNGTITLSGQTASEDFPVTAGAFQPMHASPNGNQPDSYLAQFEAEEVTALEDLLINLSASVSLFPNPTSNKVSIATNGQNIKTMMVIAISGQVLMKVENINDVSQVLETDSLPKGQYFVKIIFADETVVVKKLAVIN